MYSLNQIRWRCRRGARELDVLLENYLDRCFETASSDERSAFIELLKLDDTEIWAFLAGERVPDGLVMAHLARKIRMSVTVRRC